MLGFPNYKSSSVSSRPSAPLKYTSILHEYSVQRERERERLEPPWHLWLKDASVTTTLVLLGRVTLGASATDVLRRVWGTFHCCYSLNSRVPTERASLCLAVKFRRQFSRWPLLWCHHFPGGRSAPRKRSEARFQHRAPHRLTPMPVSCSLYQHTRQLAASLARHRGYSTAQNWKSRPHLPPSWPGPCNFPPARLPNLECGRKRLDP